MGVLAGLPFYVIFFEELFLVESSLVPKSVVVVISAYGFDFVGGGDGALCGGTIGVECKDPFKPVTGLGVVDGDGTMWVPSQVPTRSALVIL